MINFKNLIIFLILIFNILESKSNNSNNSNNSNYVINKINNNFQIVNKNIHYFDKIRSEPIFNLPNDYGYQLNETERYCFINALHYINLYYISQSDNPISRYDNIDVISESVNDENGNTSYFIITAKFNDQSLFNSTFTKTINNKDSTNDFQYRPNIARFYISYSTIQISKINDILYQYAKHLLIEGLQKSSLSLKSFIEILD